MATPHEILEVSPDADEATVNEAFRRRVKEAHPDHGGTVEEFRAVRAAYDELREGDPVEAPGVEADPDEPSERYTVEYLNYEVLDDYGWHLDDDDLFERAAAADLDVTDHGRIEIDPDEPLLDNAEGCGLAWPYACRGGACANCAVAVVEGEFSTPSDHILPAEMTDCGIHLSCIGAPTTPETKVVYNVKHLPDLDDLRLPADRFERAYASD